MTHWLDELWSVERVCNTDVYSTLCGGNMIWHDRVRILSCTTGMYATVPLINDNADQRSRVYHRHTNTL